MRVISPNLSDDFFWPVSEGEAVEKCYSVLDTSECSVKYLEIVRMLFYADSTDSSAVKESTCRKFKSSIELQP